MSDLASGTLEWQAPLFLLFWLLLPPLAWLRLRPAGRPAMRHAGFALIQGGRSWRTVLAWIPLALEILALGLLATALARPQLTNREVVVESEGIDILLAIDVSGSMDSPDFSVGGRPATRLDVSKRVVAEFVEGRPHDRIGLVVFGEEAFTQVPLTLDHDSLSDFLGNLQIGMAGRNATAVGQALAVACNRLARLDAPSRVVVLLTDGRSNAGRIAPLQAAEAAKALGIRVYTIGVGSADGAPGGGLFGLLGGRGDQIDEATLRSIAEVTEGRYFRATDTSSLQEIYRTIDELEKSTAEVSERVHREELYRLALLPGLALAGLQVLLVSTVFRRLP